MKYSAAVLFACLLSFASESQHFSATIDQKTKDSIQAYSSRQTLPTGLIYGDSVRNYSLRHKTAQGIHSDMTKLKCAFQEDVLRDPKDNKPISYNQRAIPLWIYLCPDGGVVRVKPLGNPANPYRPQPNATKGLRYPFDSKFIGFADETIKVDNQGNAIPKSRADLKRPDVVEEWAVAAHTDLEIR